MDPASSSSEQPVSTILVVDDSATMRMSVEMSLRLSGYRVVIAENGDTALRLLAEGLRPDLVLTDIVMPGVDGLGLIREARKLLRFTPIVALTTQGQRSLRDEGKAAGATAWLIKPTGGDDLIALVRRFLGEKARHARGPRAQQARRAG
ncbi:response regulator [Aquabacterium sp. OR-4]|uniref:response regulator n=1 Tax=Aquabacterium sp. OR-4 TaxID=2978127 RepID=UPI0028C7EF8C|nr:response regulator [Aquabacterium sp. OR-4]MDT7835973.1 response regulator [Aquabacterium sp. OR-4]